MSDDKTAEQIIHAMNDFGRSVRTSSTIDDLTVALGGLRESMSSLSIGHPGADDTDLASEVLERADALRTQISNRPMKAVSNDSTTLEQVMDRVQQGRQDVEQADTIREKIDAVKDTLKDIKDIVFN